MPPLRLVTYNFLSGGSARRPGHWSRVVGTLKADLVFAQECRPPEASHGERFRPQPGDSLAWRAARLRWGTALFARATQFTPITLPRWGGWVTGGELRDARWGPRPVRAFSIHGPAGERGYVRTMHAILDSIVGLGGRADLLLGGDFNVAVGYRGDADSRTLGRAERELLDRIGGELGLLACWQALHPGKPLAQTLRWTFDPTTPYHCDGVFVPVAWRPRLVGCRVVRGAHWRRLSDHDPVLVELAPA